MENILKEIDFNETNAIDFSEFLYATVNFQKSLNEQKLRQIFEMIDIDKNGHIDEKELKNFFHIKDDDNLHIK